jgi:tyrosine-protein kinase Etk/Wzc
MSDNHQSGAAEALASADHDDEISLLDLAIVIARRKRLVIGLPAVVAVLAILISLALPNIYTASVRILSPQQAQSSAAAMLAQLGGVLGAGGGGGGGKSSNDLYLAMLKSRTLTDRLIDRFDLMNRWEGKFRSDIRGALEGVTKATSGKDGIITIEVDGQDPKFAAEIANAYVEELVRLTSSLAVTEAAQRRLFFEKQLALAQDNMARAEKEARQSIEQGGIAMIDEQGRTLLEATAQLRAQIAVKEVQIASMRSYAAEQNPDLVAARQQLDVLKAQMARYEGQTPVLAPVVGEPPARSPRRGDPAASASRTGTDATAAYASAARVRDVKYHQVVFEMLARQYEAAKLDEAKDTSVIQVLDPAQVPDRKSKPKRAIMVILATLAAGFLAILVAFIQEAMAKAGQDPQQAQRLATLRRYLSWRQDRAT